MNILTLDMGTSSTRIALHYNEIFDEIRGDFGARYSLFEGKNALYARTKELICEILQRNSLSECDVEYIVASGMATSEMGLCEVAHKPISADVYTISKELTKKLLPESKKEFGVTFKIPIVSGRFFKDILSYIENIIYHH